MAFHETIRLKESIERGTRGGPGFRTSVAELFSGHEKRNRGRAQPRQKFNVRYGIQSAEDLIEVSALFYIAGGKADGFRIKDWGDYEVGDTTDVSTRQFLFTTDGVTATFPSFKRYQIGSVFFDRKLRKLVSGTARLWANDLEKFEGGGADQWQLDLTTGIWIVGSTITALSGPLVEAIFEFDVAVRFEIDEIEKRTEYEHLAQYPDIPLREIRQD